jgi:pantetheine-phosphate adenylyltransferase
MAVKRVGVYPGTFDPVTNGHMDIVRRATTLVDRLVIAVSINAGKGPLLPLPDRVELLRGEISDARSSLNSCEIDVVPFDTLLMRFVQEQGGHVIIRGLRAISDFEYEFQMAGMNARLNPRIETVFLMASERNQFISSRFVKEIGRLGGDVGQFVSARVVARLAQAFSALEK